MAPILNEGERTGLGGKGSKDGKGKGKGGKCEDQGGKGKDKGGKDEGAAGGKKGKAAVDADVGKGKGGTGKGKGKGPSVSAREKQLGATESHREAEPAIVDTKPSASAPSHRVDGLEQSGVCGHRCRAREAKLQQLYGKV